MVLKIINNNKDKLICCQRFKPNKLDVYATLFCGNSDVQHTQLFSAMYARKYYFNVI